MTNLLLPRRTLLAVSASGLAGALASRLVMPASALAAPAAAKTAPKNCIVLWLNGGPSHIDTFDPKPGQPTGGTFKAIKTRAKGVELSEHLPGIADVADKLAFVRMTSKEGNHQRARYLVHTGYAPNPTVVHPSIGGWASHETGDKSSEIPQFISINGPAPGAGFLGVQHGPFTIQKAGTPPANLALARNVDDKRFDARLSALAAMEADFEKRTGDAQVSGRKSVYDQSVRLMRSSKTRVFDLADEPEKIVKMYGDSDFGRGCLLARRLVESGARVAEVVLDGWDTHKDGFERIKKLSAALDGGFSGLVRDLADRKLLDSTLIVCMGEFGRTPKINDDEGRDHYPQAWTAVLAGGGIKGGVAHGKTDAAGAKTDAPTTVPDLSATIFSALGVTHDKSFSTPSGRPISITDGGTPVKELLK